MFTDANVHWTGKMHWYMELSVDKNRKKKVILDVGF